MDGALGKKGIAGDNCGTCFPGFPGTKGEPGVRDSKDIYTFSDL